MTDSCEISAALPEILAGATAASLSTTVTPQAFCHQEEPFLTDAPFQGIYRIPKIDVQVAGTYQTVPGPNVLANYTATSAFLQPFLGRPLSAQATSQTINLLIPNSEYGERVNQIDMRVSKVFRMSGARRLLAGHRHLQPDQRRHGPGPEQHLYDQQHRVDASDPDPDGALLQAERDLRLLTRTPPCGATNCRQAPRFARRRRA
jgi:hypothetical protein